MTTTSRDRKFSIISLTCKENQWEHCRWFARLATTDMGRKLRGSAPFVGGELGPHLTQCRLGWGLYLPTKWHLDPSSHLATRDMGLKLGGKALPPFGYQKNNKSIKLGPD